MKQISTFVTLLLCLSVGKGWAQTDIEVITTIPNPLQADCRSFTDGIDIQVQYQNVGTTPITTTPLGYQEVGGGAPAVAETSTATLPPGGVTTYTFTVPYVLTTPNTFFDIKIWAAQPGDNNPANDTITASVLSPPKATVPYMESFESFTVGDAGAPFGLPGVLNNAWERSTANTTQGGWFVSNSSTPTSNTGPAANHTPGGSVFMHMEANGGSSGTQHTLNSLCIDLAGTSAPRLNFWYHMFGSNIGTLEVRAIVGGTTLTLWSLSGQQQVNEIDPWLEAVVDLSAFAGDVIQLSFVGTRGSGSTGDIGLDDISIMDPPPLDPGVTEILFIGELGCYGSNEEISVSLQNFGSQAIDFTADPVTINLVINGPIPASYSLTLNSGTLPLLGSQAVTITSNADLSATGTYGLEIFISTPNDPNSSNDTVRTTTTTLAKIVGPYKEDFESFPVGGPNVAFNGWLTFSTNVQSWHIGTGTTPTANTGPSGNHTPGGSKYAFSEQTIITFPLPPPGDLHALLSPCIDVSSMVNPKFSFYYHMFGSQIGTLEVLLITGDTTLSVFSQTGQVQTSSNAPWDSTVIDLAPFKNDLFQIAFLSLRGSSGAGLGDVGDIAIDDINIFDPAPHDVQVVDIPSPTPQCVFGTNEPVSVSVVNFGSDVLTNMVAQFSVDGGPFGAPETIPGSLQPGDTLVYTFIATADLSAPGTHDITVVTTQNTPLDANKNNDSLSVEVFNYQNEVSSFPYFEDFEGGPRGWIASGPANPWAFGTPNKLTIRGAASGDSAWVTGLTSNHISNADGFVVGPCFNFASLVVPVFKMDIWYESEFSWDGAVLQYSTDNGETWFNVGDFGDPNNWYNDNTINSNPGGSRVGWTGRTDQNNGSGQWITAEHDLDGLGGLSSVLLRIAFASDGSTQDDGFAFDNISIREKPAFDAEGIRITEPLSGCGLSASTKISVEFANRGTSPITVMGINYQVNNGPIITETVTPNLAFGAATVYSFNTTADLSMPGQYLIKAWTNLPGDADASNDTATFIATSIPQVATFPYNEDFENGPGGWTTEGTPNTWALGFPQKDVIQGAASDSNAWVTGGLGNGSYLANENSFVLSPCLNFASLSAPIIRMAVWWNAENNWDGAVLQSSVDGGLTWQRVGDNGDPINWYNSSNVRSNPGGQSHGWTGRNSTGNGSGGWVVAQHDLTGLAGLSDVRLRIAFSSDGSIQDDGFAFDDVTIFDRASNDLEAIGFPELKLSVCDDDSIEVRLQMANNGTQAQANTPLRVEIEGPSPTVLNGSIPGILNPGDTVTAIIGTFGPITPGQYILKGYAVLPADTIRFNDTTFSNTEIVEIPANPNLITDSICTATGASFTIRASSNAQNVNWYDANVGGTLVNQGFVFQTPVLNNSTVYYAEASNATLAGLGPENGQVLGGGGQYGFNAGLELTALRDFTLESVRVFPDGSGGQVVIELTPRGGGTAVWTRTITLPAGVTDTVLRLDENIPTGNWDLRRAGGTTTELFRNNDVPGGVYPFTLPGIVSITSSTLNQDFYYFFYDWVITTAGCTSDRVPVEAVILPPATVDLGRDGIQCVGFQLDASADPSITDWQWYVDQGSAPISTTPRYNVDSSGVYEVFVENAAGCTDRDTVVLQIIPKPEINAGRDTAGCDGVVLKADSILGGSYFWFGPNAGTQDPTQNTYRATITGNYLLTINGGGCTNTDTVFVNILPGPDVNLGRDIETCDTVVLDPNVVGTAYLWSTGDTGATLRVPPPLGGTISQYDVIVTNNLGCTTRDTIQLEPGNSPFINLGPDKRGCDRVTLFAGVSSVDYLWSTGETTQSISVNQPGDYTLTVFDRDGCAAQDTVKVELDFTPTAAASYVFGNSNQEVIFTNTTTPANATYTWDFGDGSAPVNDVNPTHMYQFPGTFPVQLIAQNGCGSDTLAFLVEGVQVSLDPNPWAQVVSIRPNPTTAWVDLQIEDIHTSMLTVEVLDLRGKQLLHHQAENVHGSYLQRMDLGQFAEGVYLLRINDGKHELRRRIVRK